MLDYKQTRDGDLDLSTGDVLVTESTFQHQRDLLLSDKGHVRSAAGVGVGAVNYLLGEDPEAFLRATRQEFAADGMKVKKVAFLEDGINLETDAAYGNG